MKKVTASYVDGIRDARLTFKAEGMEHAVAYLENLNRTIARFGSDSPVGQYLRGERDFWRNQIKR